MFGLLMFSTIWDSLLSYLFQKDASNFVFLLDFKFGQDFTVVIAIKVLKKINKIV